MKVWDFTFLHPQKKLLNFWKRKHVFVIFMYIFCILEGSTDFFEDMALRSTLSLERHIIFVADFSDLGWPVSVTGVSKRMGQPLKLKVPPIWCNFLTLYSYSRSKSPQWKSRAFVREFQGCILNLGWWNQGTEFQGINWGKRRLKRFQLPFE